jgi:hypothetical protein
MPRMFVVPLRSQRFLISKLNFYSHRLVEYPVGLVIVYPRVRRGRRVEHRVKLEKDVGELHAALHYLGHLATTHITVVPKKNELKEKGDDNAFSFIYLLILANFGKERV